MPLTEAERQAYEVSLFANRSPGELYGREWGDPETARWLRPVLDLFMRPEIEKRRRLCEIGSGGGRWSRFMIRSGKPTLLIDGLHGSEELIKALPWTPAEAELLQSETSFLVLPSGVIHESHHGKYDYVFSFDTFVHFDMPLFLAYLRSISLMLMPGGVLHLHYADLQNADWFRSFDISDDWEPACRSFRYVGREDLSALLYKLNLRRTDREICFGANGSRLIECIKGPNG